MDQHPRKLRPARIGTWQLWLLIAVAAMAVVVTIYLTVRQMSRGQKDADAQPSTLAIARAAGDASALAADPAAPPPRASAGIHAAG